MSKIDQETTNLFLLGNRASIYPKELKELIMHKLYESNLGVNSYKNLIECINKLLEDPLTKSLSEEIRYDEEMELIMNAGHILGLNGTVTIRKPSSKTERDIEIAGGNDQQSLQCLIRLMREYLKTMQENSELSIFFKQIVSAFQTTIGKIDYEQLAKRINEQNDLIIIPAGWRTHSFTLAFYRNRLIICNRGAGMSSSGTMIYRNHTRKITSDFLLSLNDDNNTREKVLKSIESEFGLENSETLLVGLPLKSQRHGTCSFVNPKSSIQGILYLLKSESEIRRSWTRLTGLTRTGFNFARQTIDETAKRFARREYKNFTNFIRNFMVSKMINNYKSKPPLSNGSICNSDADRSIVYLELFMLILEQHHGQDHLDTSHDRTEKKKQELERAEMIISALREKGDLEFVLDILEKRGVNISIPNKPRTT